MRISKFVFNSIRNIIFDKTATCYADISNIKFKDQEAFKILRNEYDDLTEEILDVIKRRKFENSFRSNDTEYELLHPFYENILKIFERELKEQ